MSLINKMLQDLDARGGDGTRGGSSSAVRPVSYGGRSGPSPAAIGAALVALAVLGGGGFAAWKYFRGGRQPVPAAAAPVAPQHAAPATVAGGEPADGAGGGKLAARMEERNAEARRAAAASGTGRNGEPRQDSASRQPAGPGIAGRDGESLNAAQTGEKAADGARRRAARTGTARDAEARRAGAGASAAPASGGAAAKRKGAAAGTAPVAAGANAAPGEGSDAGLSSQQKAENEYRRALAKLQDARVSEALASLEQAVYLYPRHEAARQTLVRLLIEAGRTQEAIRHLVFATSLDPRQASMAMLLARLQVEHGGNALETLQRSLPYAESNAEYRALMAGVLQRANRHKEAADQYQAAVRLQPGNAVWWMGLGISLQAEKRNAEAKIAFQRARDTGRLSPELQTFVERRLQQLD